MSSNDSITVLDATSIQILDILHDNDFMVSDQSGFASRQITEQLEDDPKKISGLLRKLEDFGLISRSISGKRTFEISMTDEGINALAKVRPIMEQNGNAKEDLSSVPTDELIEGLRYHLQNMHDANTCQVEEFENLYLQAEAKLEVIRETMENLDLGHLTWIQAFDKVNNILNASTD